MGRNPIARRLGLPTADEATVIIGSRGDVGGPVLLFGGPLYRNSLLQMVEAQDAFRCCMLRDHCDVAVAGKLLYLIVGRHFPTIDLPNLRRCRRRKRIQCQPLDPIEMRDLWS